MFRNSYKDRDGVETKLSLVSTIHDQKRRKQRNIEKIDLEKCVLYGECETQYTRKGIRYKYTYQDITFITDATKKVAITSWAEPLPLPPVVTTIEVKTAYKLRASESAIKSNMRLGSGDYMQTRI